MSVSPADVIKIVAEMAVAGQQVMNVWHAFATDPASNDDAIADILHEIDQIYQLIYTAQSTDTAYVSVHIDNVTQNVSMGEHPWEALGFGVSSGSQMPTGVAGLLTLPTAIPRVRGRKFFGGFTEDDNVGGLWRTNLTDAIADIGARVLDGFIGATTSNPWGWVVLDQNGDPVGFTEALVSNVPAYQRRRKLGVGS